LVSEKLPPTVLLPVSCVVDVDAAVVEVVSLLVTASPVAVTVVVVAPVSTRL
jgi:hypothetical protein